MLFYRHGGLRGLGMPIGAAGVVRLGNRVHVEVPEQQEGLVRGAQARGDEGPELLELVAPHLLVGPRRRVPRPAEEFLQAEARPGL